MEEKKEDQSSVLQDTELRESYEASIRRRPLMRVMSVVCLIILFGLIVATFITGITGSKYFLGCLVLMMIVPVLMYVILWVGRVLNRHFNK